MGKKNKNEQCLKGSNCLSTFPSFIGHIITVQFFKMASVINLFIRVSFYVILIIEFISAAYDSYPVQPSEVKLQFHY